MRKNILAFLFLSQLQAGAQPIPENQLKDNSWIYQRLSFNSFKTSPNLKSPLIIAIVDDGFRLSHTSLKKYIYQNEKEKPNNLIDDDMNGYIDDVNGWDISDQDALVTLPEGREKTFYHGTYIASIIVQAIEQCLGTEAYKYVKLMPVKVLSDQAKNTYLAEGYKGIQYAAENGAHIICCAWSGGQMSLEQKKTLEEVRKKDILLIASSGNLSTEKIEAPASFPGFVTIAAIDASLVKTKTSNFGMRVDLSCPGKNVKGASSLSDTGHTFHEGTSPATAVATACIGLMKLAYPDASPERIKESLINTAKPIDSLNAKYAGKLGAGIPQLSASYLYLRQNKIKRAHYVSYRTKETLYLGTSCSSNIRLSPKGHFKSIRITAKDVDQNSWKKEIEIQHQGSTWFKGTLSDISNGIEIPFSQIEIKAPQKGSKCIRLDYFVETVDSSKLFCEKTKFLESDAGTIVDGSGPSLNYANGCDCQWQISVPNGKRVQLICDSLDTEPNVDYVWIFDGTMALPENIIAKFSGNSLPPPIVSRSSNVLIWFVSNEQIARKGWNIRYRTLD